MINSNLKQEPLSSSIRHNLKPKKRQPHKLNANKEE